MSERSELFFPEEKYPIPRVPAPQPEGQEPKPDPARKPENWEPKPDPQPANREGQEPQPG
ncbi:hypothetical protein [Marinobacter sp. NSM]|uniref:hypothetical protein n=1 Tax=Marinobacter sp. NSM TaxID=3458004 RepID=UPI00403741F0